MNLNLSEIEFDQDFKLCDIDSFKQTFSSNNSGDELLTVNTPINSLNSINESSQMFKQNQSLNAFDSNLDLDLEGQ